jgi:hypothetical protein
MAGQVKTNAVKFGSYGIILNKEQLFYYVDGELFRVTDVSYEFNFDDLMELALKIAAKKDATKVSFVHRNDIVNVK